MIIKTKEVDLSLRVAVDFPVFGEGRHEGLLCDEEVLLVFDGVHAEELGQLLNLWPLIEIRYLCQSAGSPGLVALR